jgi:peptide-methionine (S)-S-oxide reductase
MKQIGISTTIIMALFALLACGSTASHSDEEMNMRNKENSMARLDTITFGAGCFWCVEAIFEMIEGVEKVQSGYCNGQVENPTYKAVCTGTTGHAEVVQISYDPARVNVEMLLEAFWSSHDPTTLNRQGADAGTQYRSGVYFHTVEQQLLAEAYKAKLNEEKVFPNPVVTEIVAIDNFYPAENYHQDYFAENPEEGYCRMVIAPKVDKFKKVFEGKLK